MSLSVFSLFQLLQLEVHFFYVGSKFSRILTCQHNRALMALPCFRRSKNYCNIFLLIAFALKWHEPSGDENFRVRAQFVLTVSMIVVNFYLIFFCWYCIYKNAWRYREKLPLTALRDCRIFFLLLSCSVASRGTDEKSRGSGHRAISQLLAPG